MCSAGILLNLVPELVVALVFFPLRMGFVHHERCICILFTTQVLVNEISIDLLVELDLSSPLFLIFREVTQYEFPDVLSNVRCLLGYAFGE